MVIVLLGACRIGFEEHVGPLGGPDAVTPDTPDDMPLPGCAGYGTLGSLPSTYRIVSTSRTWLAAETACEADGAHLAVIDDAAENMQLVTSAPSMAWFGTSDRITEGTFLVVVGGPAAYTNWQLGAPTNDAEDCVQLRSNGFWEDGDCNANFPSVCECDGRAVVAGSY